MKKFNDMLRILLLGAGGHAKVLIDILNSNNQKIIGILTPDSQLWGKKLKEVPILGGDDKIEQYSPEEIALVNGIGSVKDLGTRIRIFNHYKQKGFIFATLIHPMAIVAKDVFLGEGVQIMANCVVQPDCKILDNTILNTSASIDHDCHIGTHCHIAPGVTLSGNISMGNNSHIGTGAVIIQNINIGANCIIAAGSVVVQNIRNNKKVKGVPATEY